MSFNKKFFTTGGIVASSEGACTADDLNPFTGEVADGGVALYSLDYDASDAGGNYDGTPTDVDFGVGGKTNYGARFNGSSSSIVVPNNILTTNDHSISMWFNLNDTNGIQTVIEFDYENRILFRAVSTDNNKAYIGNSGYFNHGLSFSAGQWYHLVITFSAGNPFKIYVNGVLSYTGGNTNVLAQSNDNIIGASNGSGANGVDGKIDQVRIFSSALTDEQVEDLFEETACVYDSTTDQNNYPVANVAYFKLDGSSENEIGTDGTDTNVTYEFGRFGQAAVFNGSTSIIDTNIVSLADSYTLSFWINPVNVTPSIWYQVIGGDDGTSNKNYDRFVAIGLEGSGTGTIGFLVNSGGTYIYSDNNLTANTWTHVVCIKDGTTSRMYINGQVQADTATVPATISYQGSLTLGKFYGGTTRSLEGSLDQVRIYSTVLDSDQVTKLYEEKQDYITKDASDPFGDSNSVALYEMENNANDTSGNGNNGTASNVTFTSTDPIRGTYEATFNGSSSKITLPASTSIAPQNNYSISIWFNTDTLGVMQTVFAFNHQNTYMSALWLHSNGTNNLRAFVAGSNYYSSDNIFSNNQWHHVVITKSSTNGLKVYFDSTLAINEPTVIGNNLQVSGSTRENNIGANKTTAESLHFDGSIDQVRIFDRAIDGTEAYQLYAEGARGTGL